MLDLTTQIRCSLKSLTLSFSNRVGVCGTFRRSRSNDGGIMNGFTRRSVSLRMAAALIVIMTIPVLVSSTPSGASGTNQIGPLCNDDPQTLSWQVCITGYFNVETIGTKNYAAVIDYKVVWTDEAGNNASISQGIIKAIVAGYSTGGSWYVGS